MKKRYLFTVSGIIGAVFGVSIMIPAMMNEYVLVATLAAILMFSGLVVFAIGMGD